jgi:hypothetical protein
VTIVSICDCARPRSSNARASSPFTLGLRHWAGRVVHATPQSKNSIAILEDWIYHSKENPEHQDKGIVSLIFFCLFEGKSPSECGRSRA